MKRFFALTLGLLLANGVWASECPLRQSTASQEVIVGPFVDSTDGVTPETALTIDAADIRLAPAAGNMVGKNAGGATHDEIGEYQITLDATDTATVGMLKISIQEAGALPVWKNCYVYEESVYDNLYAAAAVGPLTAAQVNTEADTALTDYDPPTNTELTARTLASAAYFDPATDIVDTVTNVTQSSVDQIQVTALADLFNTNSGTTYGAAVAGSVVSEIADNAGGSGLTAGGIADAVWDEARSGHTTAGTFGEHVLADVVEWLGSIPTALETATSIRQEIDTNSTQLAAIVADTNELQTDNVPGLIAALPTDADVRTQADASIENYRLDEFFNVALSAQPAAGSFLGDLTQDDAGTQQFTVNALENGPSGSGASASAIADAVWDEARSGHSTAGTFGEHVNADVIEWLGSIPTALQTAVDFRTEMDSNSTQLASIVADTNELQTDDVPGLIAALPTASVVNTQVDAAIETYRLDELIVTALASQPVGGSILGDLTQDDAGTQQFTINALENGPSGSGASAAAIADAVWTETVADHSGTVGSTAEALAAGGGGGASASAIADAVWDEPTSGHTTSGSFGEQAATNVPAILADTNEVQGDLVNGGRLDVIFDAILADTNELQSDDYPTLIAALPTANEIWQAACEDQGTGYSCQEVMSLLLAEAMGVCTYTTATRTFACQDPSGGETRFTLIYGTELDGDRTSSTPAPFTP